MNVRPPQHRPSAAFAFAALASLILLASVTARAEDYEAIIDIDSEQDLYDLEATGAISDETRETLVELLDQGVDLNSASREELYALPGISYAEADAILEYRKLDGFIEDPRILVEAGAITQEDLQQMAPFLIIAERSARIPISGKVRFQSKYVAPDPLGAPPVLLKARLRLPWDLSVGAALLTTRHRLGQVTWDEAQGGFLAKKASYAPVLPKAFIQWKSTERMIVLGTYRIGFGERLTLDNTTRKTPDGVYADDTVKSDSDPVTFCRYTNAGENPCVEEAFAGVRATPDYGWQDAFRGVAGSIEDLAVGKMKLALHAFGSYQTRSIYQYELFSRLDCDDPRDPNCKSPPVYEAPEGLRVYRSSTLPNLFDELAGGGNVTLTVDEGTRVGLTGYYATEIFRLSSAQLDFQEHSRFISGPFGAIGLNGATTFGPLNLFAEGARSLNQVPGGKGGGWAVTQRTVYSQKKQELELSLRYYDRDFLNPYGRPVSAADKFEGQRARNELGARFRYVQSPNEDWRLRSTLDFWVLPSDGKVAGSAGTPNFTALGRADFVGWNFLQAGAWVAYARKGINTCSGELEQFELALDPDAVQALEQDLCDTHYARLTTRVTAAPWGRNLTFGVIPSMKRVFDGAGRTDAHVWLEVAARPTEQLKVRARTRYQDFTLFADDEGSERTSWSWAEVTWSPTRLFLGRVRYDAFVYLDQRESTLARKPNPEHRFRLEVETKF